MNFRKTEEDESVLKIVLSQNKDYKVWGAEDLFKWDAIVKYQYRFCLLMPVLLKLVD